MEVEDNLRLRNKSPLLSLEHSEASIGTKVISSLKQDFLTGIPFAYLLREAEFYGRRFYVNEHVLIPRSETELLVDYLVKSGKTYARALDVGVGSGVILLSLLKEGVVLEGEGGDISPQALQVASINVQRLKMERRVKLLLSDRLENISGKFDLIVSNPPYIKPMHHQSLIHSNIAHEPEQALFVDDSEYESWFETFFLQVQQELNPGGVFMMEGHEMELAGQAETLARMGFLQVQVLKDWAGKNRFLYGSVS